MNPRIASIENLIASDPGGRNVFDLMMPDQLESAAESLRRARRVGIVTGFHIRGAGAGETDGPPGAKVLGQALETMGVVVDYITDRSNAPLLRAMGLDPLVHAADYLNRCRPTHLVSIERAGRGADGRYRNMHGDDITAATEPLDELFLSANRRGVLTIGVGDGGNEIGMGKVFAEILERVEHGRLIATTVATDFCIAAGVSNWGAFGLAGALSVLVGRDLLPSAEAIASDLERIVRVGGGVDGVTLRREPTTDGVPLGASLRMLESIRRHLLPTVFALDRSLVVGILGYGESGRAAAALSHQHGHRVRVSDMGPVSIAPAAGAVDVESGGHSVAFFRGCDVVVASPGVPVDSEILNEIHRRGIPVISELELAFQLGWARRAGRDRKLIAVTGTVGKRTTVEWLASLFGHAGRAIAIGGNRGKPLSELLLDRVNRSAIALAVSSFQLESAVHFRPGIAVILNIEEAHLDRHRSIAEYVRVKSRVFMNQGPADVLILPHDDERLRRLAPKHRGRTLLMSTRHAVDRGAWLVEGVLRFNIDGEIESLGKVETEFPENLLASVLVARLSGMGSDELRSAVAAVLSGVSR